MGQEILYCNKCGTKLHGEDFTRGRAHTIENRQFCQKCVSINLTTGQKTVPVEKPGTSRMRPKAPAAPPRLPSSSPAPPKSRALPVVVAALVVVAVAGAVGVLLKRPPAPAVDGPPKPDPTLAARQKEKMAHELKELEPKIAPLLQGEQFAAVATLLEEARKRYDAPEWTGPIARRIKEVRELPAAAYPALKERATAAQARGASADVQQLRARMAGWGRKDLLDDLEAALKAIVPREPLPPGARVLVKFPDEGPVRYRTTGTLKDGALYARSAPDAATAGLESGVEIFKLPEAGEVRVTYSTNSPARITVILRGPGADGKSTPFHFFVEKPEIGRPATVKMSAAKLIDWDNKLAPKGTAVDNIFVRQEDGKAVLAVHEFVVFSTKD